MPYESKIVRQLYLINSKVIMVASYEVTLEFMSEEPKKAMQKAALPTLGLSNR